MKLSVIIPVHNGNACLSRCLEALRASTRTPDEIIVVDDASTDGSADLARHFGAWAISLGNSPVGPATARNQGAAGAKGDILIFVDADIMVHRDTLAKIEEYLLVHAETAALFGSYDDTPPHRGLVTLYKNLQHHFVHQHGKREASTFWAGCGAMRREVFQAIGGFDERYTRPSIEDIELGVRLSQAGYRVHLCPEIEVTHLKQWHISSLLRSDILDRALPWARLIVSRGQLPSDLNLDMRGRLSALFAWAIVVFGVFGYWLPWGRVGALLATLALVILNNELYILFLRRGGLGFAIGAFGLHILYFLYSSFVFSAVVASSLLTGKKRRFNHAA